MATQSAHRETRNPSGLHKERSKRLIWRCVVLYTLLFSSAGFLRAQDGPAMYKRYCATCHDAGAERVPSRENLKALSAEQVLSAMETGAMISMASRLSAAERRAVAEFVTGKSIAQPLETRPRPQAMCADAPGTLNEPLAGPMWNGWGVTSSNTRFQGASGAGITAAEAPRLKLKWAFGYPGDVSAAAQPTVVGGRVFVGSQGGKVYSLSAANGCVYWWFEGPALVRTAVSVGRIETEAGAGYSA